MDREGLLCLTLLLSPSTPDPVWGSGSESLGLTSRQLVWLSDVFVLLG